MDKIIIKKVSSRQEMDDFLQVVKKIYANCPQYVPEFENDVRGLFDIKTNPGLDFPTSNLLLHTRTV